MTHGLSEMNEQISLSLFKFLHCLYLMSFNCMCFLLLFVFLYINVRKDK